MMLTTTLSLLIFLLCCSQSLGQFVTSTTSQPCASFVGTSYPAIITQGPKLELRAVNSVCGYWSTWISTWTTYTISCDSGVPCTFGGVGNQYFGYCSSANAQPVTAVYDYGEGPVAGCGPGQLCCETHLPAFGTYIFDVGVSSFLGCAASRFWQPATATIAGSPSTTSTNSTLTATPTNTSSSGKLTTVNIITIAASVAGGIGALVGAIIAVMKYRRKKRAGSSTGDGRLVGRTGTDRGQNHYHLHFNDRVNVSLQNSEVYLTGGHGGTGSNMRIAGYGRTPRITSGGSSSRLLSN